VSSLFIIAGRSLWLPTIIAWSSANLNVHLSPAFSPPPDPPLLVWQAPQCRCLIVAATASILVSHLFQPYLVPSTLLNSQITVYSSLRSYNHVGCYLFIISIYVANPGLSRPILKNLGLLKNLKKTLKVRFLGFLFSSQNF